jgi:hypothetical protein
MSAKVFHLWLSTKLTSPASNLAVPLNNTGATKLNNISWMVDWDSLFRGWNKKYKRCSVKFQLNMDSFTGISTAWETLNGVLVCNLASNTGSSTNGGTALGLYYPITNPTGGTTHCMALNYLGNQNGVDIIVPQDNAVFTLSFSGINTSGQLHLNNTTIGDYQILLQFELSEPIQEPLPFREPRFP